MQPMVTAAEMREMDRITIEDAGLPGLVLMDNAGRAVADVVRDVVEELGGGLVAVVCGKGNNGGDGMVVARYLHGWGAEVVVLLCAAREDVLGDALVQLDIADTLGVEIIEAPQGVDEPVADALATAAVIVDALLGTGLNDEVRPELAEIIEGINEADVPVIAVDLPSGVHADTGAVMGHAVIADATVTFAFPKRGHMVHPGCDLTGELQVVDIGIPGEVVEHVGPMAFTDADMGFPYLPPRVPNSHKGTYGHVLVVGGGPGKSGAIVMAGLAALRTGAGLVTLFTDDRTRELLEGRYPELMFATGTIAAACEGKSAIVVGPGLPHDGWGPEAVATVLASGVPVVADAGALDMLAPGVPSPAVITPHPGEAGRMLGRSAAQVQADRFAALDALVESTGSIVVLKGSRTLIGARGVVFVNSTGNAGMSTAGSGDVLAGMIGAMLPRLDPLEAARTAAYVHGLAGDQVAARLGEDSLIATDIIEALPAVLIGDGDSEDL